MPALASSPADAGTGPRRAGAGAGPGPGPGPQLHLRRSQGPALRGEHVSAVTAVVFCVIDAATRPEIRVWAPGEN